MRLRSTGEIFDVEIAPRHEAAKVDGVVYRKRDLEMMRSLTPAEVLAAHRTRKAFDGDLVSVT